MSNNILILIMIPSVFLLIYLPFIKREDKYLKKHFGKQYIDYFNKTPRIIPKLNNFKHKEIISYSSSLIISFKDSIWWFIGAIFFTVLNKF